MYTSPSSVLNCEPIRSSYLSVFISPGKPPYGLVLNTWSMLCLKVGNVKSLPFTSKEFV